MTRREFLTWHDVPGELPDDDLTVLVRVADADSEPVWFGWHCNGQWYSNEGFEIDDVLRWAHVPTGEANG